jgi:cytochrome c-type biogenesis protein CcmH/NrfF
MKRLGWNHKVGKVVSHPSGAWMGHRRVSFWLKTGQALALAVAVCFTLGATDAGTRYTQLNHKTMCTCGCAEILGECNHVGCSSSTEELAMISGGIDNNQNDQAILDSMVSKYGAVVLAAPTKQGFDLVAAALLGTILLLRHWKLTRPQLEPAPASPEMDALRERIRRETGVDGGFEV